MLDLEGFDDLRTSEVSTACASTSPRKAEKQLGLSLSDITDSDAGNFLF